MLEKKRRPRGGQMEARLHGHRSHDLGRGDLLIAGRARLFRVPHSTATRCELAHRVAEHLPEHFVVVSESIEKDSTTDIWPLPLSLPLSP